MLPRKLSLSSEERRRLFRNVKGMIWEFLFGAIHHHVVCLTTGP